MHPSVHSSTIYMVKTKKQPKNSLTDEWIKKMWYIYIVEYYLSIKKNEIMMFAAAWMDLEIIILSEASQRKTNKSHMWNLKYDTKELI